VGAVEYRPDSNRCFLRRGTRRIGAPSSFPGPTWTPPPKPEPDSYRVMKNPEPRAGGGQGTGEAALDDELQAKGKSWIRLFAPLCRDGKLLREP